MTWNFIIYTRVPLIIHKILLYYYYILYIYTILRHKPKQLYDLYVHGIMIIEPAGPIQTTKFSSVYST